MQPFKKLAILLLSLIIVVGLLSMADFAVPSTDPWKSPQQITVSMTENPQNEMVVTWTTIDLTLAGAQVEVTPVNGGDPLTFAAVKTNRSVSGSSQRTESGENVTRKAFYIAGLTGLLPDTVYQYVCSAIDEEGTVHESTGNIFKTAGASPDEFSFIYFSDPQVAGTNGKALTANSSLWSQHDPGFVFIAGDLTDTAVNEGQWEIFFNQKTPGIFNGTRFSNNYSNAMSDYVIAVVQGNHDDNTFANHLNYPASGGTNITYAYTYGSMHFIMLNLEHPGSRSAQEDFLRQHVAYAKENDLWSVIGFHKSIYSGASHMNDKSVSDTRNYWGPVFAELGVDIVLQGHDHVLSRGFIDESGNNVRNSQDINYQMIDDRTYTADKPSHAPLYYVGNCASTLKFYSASVNSAPLAAPDYGFLDLNSARPAGHAQNPYGPQTKDSDPLPTYINIIVTSKAITFETWMFRYDSKEDLISTEPFLYDSLTVTRKLPKNPERGALVKRSPWSAVCSRQAGGT